MKPLYPRPDYIPDDFVFAGQGQHFKPKFGDEYCVVFDKDNQWNNRVNTVVDLDGTVWDSLADFYIPRPKKVMKEKKKVKYQIIDSKTGNPRWEIHGELGVAAKCPTRELARKVKRALSL